MRIILLLFCSWLALGLGAQTAQVQFGKNRVQYHTDFDEWRQYESDNFITYWYGEGRNIGQMVVMYAEQDFNYLQGVLEHRMNEKVQLIVYVDVTDVKQSNIGGEEVFSLPGSSGSGNAAAGRLSVNQAKFLGNKAFVYFNGDHNDLRRQVREAIASVYLEHMLFGSNIQEVVQNALLMNLPPWFKAGLVAYLGQDWNALLDDQLRHLLASGKYRNFEHLAEDYPRLAGQAFWYYIASSFGEPSVSSLLYLTRIHRSVESGFLYVLGSPYEMVLFNWKDFFTRRYAEDLQNRSELTAATPIPIRNKKNHSLTEVKMSPDGQRIAYVLNDIGRYRVYLQDLTSGERQVIYKSGSRNQLQATDYDYPLLAFSPTNQELSILFEFRDVPKLLRYNLNTQKATTEDLGPQLQRVHSMEYLNPNTLLLSATRSGFSDIYLYYPATRQSLPITNDFYDDLDAVPVRIRGRQGILFASNRLDTLKSNFRLDTILPASQFDIFYYDLEGKPNELVRITNTPFANERSPLGIDEHFFSYLSDASGIYNSYRGYLEDFVHHIDQIIYLNDGSQIRLHADSSLLELDSSLIDSILLEPIIRERAITTATSDLPFSLIAQTRAQSVNRGLTYFLQPGYKPTSNKPSGRLQAQVVFTPLDTTTQTSPRPSNWQRYNWQKRGYLPSLHELGNQQRNQPDTIRQNTALPLAPAVEKLDEGILFQTRFQKATPPPSLTPSPEEDDPSPKPIDTQRTDLPSTTVAQPNPIKTNRPTNPQLKGEQISLASGEVYKFRPGQIIAHRTTFRANYLRTTIDNSPLFDGLNAFAANPTGFTQQPLGILMKGNVMDLFEDHVVEGGLRLPTAFNGTEYFLIYHNRKKRLDTYYAAYRRNRRRDEGAFIFGPRRIDENTLIGQFGLRYPLDVFSSFRATATLRRDRVQTLPTEQSALQENVFQNQRIGARIEYVFDNTIDLSENLRQGTRYKIYTDFSKSFTLQGSDDGRSGFDPGFMGVVGADIRHYEKIDKHSILALRLAAATNLGGQKVLYYLGGSDNSLLQNFNQSIPTPTPENGNFLLQDLANPLRGFDINTRNGSTYLLANAELRVPVFTYLFRNIRSSLIRDFQLVSFFDIGSAWIGSNPYSEDNPVNITTYPNPSTPNPGPVSVTVIRYREPIVYGYGLGARTSLFGYFVRVDYAWGVETRVANPAKWHLSLGYDF